MTARKDFLESIHRDFTYQAEITDNQSDLLRSVNDAFDIAKNELRENLTNIVSMYRDAECMKVLRKAERRANAAVVLDFNPEDTSVTREVRTYEVTEEVLSTQQTCCFIVTKTFYILAMRLGGILPLGRNAALTKTLLEDARGEFIDAIQHAFSKK